MLAAERGVRGTGLPDCPAARPEATVLHVPSRRERGLSHTVSKDTLLFSSWSRAMQRDRSVRVRAGGGGCQLVRLFMARHLLVQASGSPGNSEEDGASLFICLWPGICESRHLLVQATPKRIGFLFLYFVGLDEECC